MVFIVALGLLRFNVARAGNVPTEVAGEVVSVNVAETRETTEAKAVRMAGSSMPLRAGRGSRRETRAW